MGFMLNRGPGSVAERSKAVVLKTTRRATASRVRIPPDPPHSDTESVEGPDWGLFSFCFKGCWQGYPPFGDWALDAEWVSEWPASLFERPSIVTGRRKISFHFQLVAAFMGSPRSRDDPVTKTDTKAQGGRKDGSVAADHELSAAVPMVGEIIENPAGSL
jgi:hypothetical protein